MSRKQSGPGHRYRDGISFPELPRRFPDDAIPEVWFVKLR